MAQLVRRGLVFHVLITVKQLYLLKKRGKHISWRAVRWMWLLTSMRLDGHGSYHLDTLDSDLNRKMPILAIAFPMNRLDGDPE